MQGPFLVLVTLLGLLVTLVSSAQYVTSICKPSPKWSIGDEEPMAEARGNVTVVALLQASCSFCLVQAASMGPLREKLSLQGLVDINYMIVNDQSLLSAVLYPKLRQRAPDGIPVYQQSSSQPDVWEVLNGDKDDFLIYDRCGRLTFHIRLPLSYLHFPYVEAAIRSTYKDDFCGNCSFYSNSTLTTLNVSAVSPSNDSITIDKQDKHTDHEHNSHPENLEHASNTQSADQTGEQQKHHHPINSKKIPVQKQHQPVREKEERGHTHK
ncbi:selenoprotein Pb-like [Rhinophrynus dorsalis]